MEEITTIGLDLAKSVFQVHAVGQDGKIVLRRQVRRAQMLEFFAKLTPCLIGMEACAGAHYWARELARSGHEVRLMPPSYVKPYVKRGKTDAIDAEAICEAVTRPNMRFVPVKTEDQQAVLMTHRTRDFFVRQQTQLRNAIRAHLGEFGIVVAKGVHNLERLLALAEEAVLPAAARQSIQLLADQFRDSCPSRRHRFKPDGRRPGSTRSPPPSRPRHRRKRSPNACKPFPASARSPRARLPPACRMCRTSKPPVTWQRRAESTPSA